MLKKSVKVSKRNDCVHLLTDNILDNVLIICELYKELPLVVMVNRIVRNTIKIPTISVLIKFIYTFLSSISLKIEYLYQRLTNHCKISPNLNAGF